MPAMLIIQKTIGSIMIHYLLLLLLESRKGHIEIFINVLLSEELHTSLKYLPSMGNVAMLLLKVCILDPVFHFWMDNDKCTEVKEFNKVDNQPTP